MKKILLLLSVALIGFAACGESEAEKQKRLSDELKKSEAEKQKKLSDELNKNIKALQDKLTADTNELNRQLKIEKAKNGP